MFWELRLLFTISWHGPYTEMAGFCFWGLKFDRYENIYKKMSVLSQCCPCEKNSWNLKLFCDPICPFSTCWVNPLPCGTLATLFLTSVWPNQQTNEDNIGREKMILMTSLRLERAAAVRRRQVSITPLPPTCRGVWPKGPTAVRERVNECKD